MCLHTRKDPLAMYFTGNICLSLDVKHVFFLPSSRLLVANALEKWVKVQ